MPVLLWLATFLGSIFTAVFSAFLQFATKKIAIILSVVSAIGFLTVAFFAAILVIIHQLATVAPDIVVQGASLIMPSNLPLIASLCLTARVVRWVYEWNVKVIQYRLS